MRNHCKSIPDRSRPGLPTTASGVAQQGTCGNYATAKQSENKSRKRGGKRVKKQREAWKGRRSLIRVGTLNIGTMTGRRRELADMMERRNVDILCLQETKWKGSKARNIGGGCKIFYNGADGRKNGIGIVLKEELAESVLEVKRVSDRLMAMKLEVKRSILNIVSAYAPQVNYSMEEKNDFWEDLDGLIESISKEERIVLGADLNGHVGEGNIGDEEIMGRYCAGTRNKEGSMVVDFGKRMDLTIVNTYFKKKDEHRVTYKSGGKSTQVDHVMCRRRNLKEMCDCKVILNECVAKQHRMVVCKMALMVKKKKPGKVKPKIRWWKLKKTSYQEAFRQEVTRILGGKDGLPDEWDKTAEMLRKTAETALGVTFGKRKGDKETWWWNKEVQESIKEKKEAKKAWDKTRNENNKKIYSTKKRSERQRRQLQWQRDVYMMICMLDWKQKKVKRSCTDWLGRETEQGKMYST